jgi:hypothetical protein
LSAARTRLNMEAMLRGPGGEAPDGLHFF